MCWQRSKIPRDIWMATPSNSNLIESAHSDVNREGTGLTLLGAVVTARRHDRRRIEEQHMHESLGIRSNNRFIDDECRLASNSIRVRE